MSSLRDFVAYQNLVFYQYTVPNGMLKTTDSGFHYSESQKNGREQNLHKKRGMTVQGNMPLFIKKYENLFFPFNSTADCFCGFGIGFCIADKRHDGIIKIFFFYIGCIGMIVVDGADIADGKLTAVILE